jgi:rubrerythrin
MSVSFKGIEKQADEFFNTIKCRVQKPYPASKMTFQDVQLSEKLLAAFANGGNSELTALTQYFVHSQTINNEELASLVFCIALDEMHHLQMLSELITSMGGELRYWSPNHAYWSGGYVVYGSGIDEKISADIFSEQEAISGYESLLRDIKRMNRPELSQVEAVISRIIEDENYHLTLLNEQYNALFGS